MLQKKRKLSHLFTHFIVFDYPPSFPDRGCDGNDRGDGDNNSKLPVHLNGPKDHRIRLEQIKWIQSLKYENVCKCTEEIISFSNLVENKVKNRRYADFDEIWTKLLQSIIDFDFTETLSALVEITLMHVFINVAQFKIALK